MKKVLMLLIVGTVLMPAVPSLWATGPQIKVQDPQPAPIAAVTWWSYLVSLFSPDTPKTVTVP